MKKPPSYSVKLEKATYLKLRDEADRKGTFVSRLLNLAVKSYLERL